MIYEVRHVTDVRYAAIVRLARFNVRLLPAAWPGQRLIDSALDVSPVPAAMETRKGPYIVNVSRMVLTEPLSALRIESRFTIEVAPRTLPLAGLCPTLIQARKAARASRDLSAMGPSRYLYPSHVVPVSHEIGAWAAPYLMQGTSLIESANMLMQAIHRDFTYDAKATNADTPTLEAFHNRHGVCQDFAHVMIAALRAHGLPAAYVSGYLRTIPPPGKKRLIGADAMHAWVNLWCGDDLGWVGLDPTNNMLAGSDHIFVAMGRDYADVAPVDGVFLGGEGQQMRVAVDVMPLEGPLKETA